MNSCAIGGCTFFSIPQVIASKDSWVWRYVMEGGSDSEGVLDVSCLEILAKDNGYLSFFHSNRQPNEDFVSKVKHVHKLIRLTKTNPAIYLNFDAIEAVEATDSKTYFFDANYPHVGMSYPDAKDLNSMEVRTILVEISDVYQRAQEGIVTKLL